jgi:hypothetical protein
MPLSLQSLSPRKFKQEHGALATARLPRDALKDPAALAQAAKSLGFKAVGTNQYQHPKDLSWVAIDGKKTLRGIGGTELQGTPKDLEALPVARVDAFAKSAAVLVSPSRTDGAAVNQLTRLGFTQLVRNYYAHADGSWVALLPGKVLRGVGTKQLDPADVQAPKASSTSAPPPASAAEAAGLRCIAPRVDDSFSAVAGIGWISGGALSRADAQLKSAGFKHAATNLYTHPDGSWLADVGGRITRGIGNVAFSNNPSSASSRTATAPTAKHFAAAIADPLVATLTVSKVNKPPPELLALGFVQARHGLLKHPDGSFIAAVQGAGSKQLYFGVGPTALTRPPALKDLPSRPMDTKAMLDCVELWNLPAAQGPAAKALEDLGYKKERAGFYRKDANHWVAFDGKERFVGVGKATYQGLPSPTALPRIKSTSAHSWTAVAKTAGLTDKTHGLGDKLKDLGFSDKGNDLFSHADGSWVVKTPDGLLRGVKSQALSDVPKAPKPGEYEIFTSKPAGPWSTWRSRFAIAKLPLFQGQFSRAEAGKVLKRLGFSEASTNHWVHPDGSSVRLAGDPPRFSSSKFQQWGFADFPYRNGTDANPMQALTRKWESFAKNGGAAPY